MPAEYSYEIEGNFNRTQDFDNRVDVIPVSDPNAATMSQRVMQYQAAVQLAQQSPQIYDMGKLHRQMLEVLGVQNADEIVKLPEDVKPADPVTENMAILKQEPVKAFKYQDHEAHIAVHMAAAQDPKILQIVGQSPFASAIQQAMAAHITEHVAFQYRREIEKKLGVEMPNEEQPLPEDVEVELSRLAKEAAEKVLQKDVAEAQQEQIMQQQQDPVVQMQQRELAIKEAEAQHNRQIDIAKLELEAAKLQTTQKIEGAKIGTKIATELDKEQRKDKREGTKIGLDIAKELDKGGS
tara:strand:+ start:232 stop:1116 length:885 start_codon:yes stop_codon:yes gene_type:complete